MSESGGGVFKFNLRKLNIACIWCVWSEWRCYTEVEGVFREKLYFLSGECDQKKIIIYLFYKLTRLEKKLPSPTVGEKGSCKIKPSLFSSRLCFSCLFENNFVFKWWIAPQDAPLWVLLSFLFCGKRISVINKIQVLLSRTYLDQNFNARRILIWGILSSYVFKRWRTCILSNYELTKAS